MNVLTHPAYSAPTVDAFSPQPVSFEIWFVSTSVCTRHGTNSRLTQMPYICAMDTKDFRAVHWLCCVSFGPSGFAGETVGPPSSQPTKPGPEYAEEPEVTSRLQESF